MLPVSAQLLNHDERVNNRLFVFYKEAAKALKNRLPAYLICADNSINLPGGVYRISGISQIE